MTSIKTPNTRADLTKQREGADTSLIVGSPSEAAMPNSMNGVMGGNGLWTIIGVLLVIFLVAAIVRMAQRK